MGGLSWWHWLVIGGAFILLFGAKKLPDAAQGLGRSLRILKSEVSAMNDDGAAAPTGSMTSSVNAPARAQRQSSASHSGGTTPHHPPASQPVRARSGQG